MRDTRSEGRRWQALQGGVKLFELPVTAASADQTGGQIREVGRDTGAIGRAAETLNSTHSAV